MFEVNPNYKSYFQYEHGKKFIYVKVMIEIYGCIESDLLWYNLYVNILKDSGLSINTYGRCVANKMIYVNQCTIVWYIDENKMSHVDTDMVTDILEEI